MAASSALSHLGADLSVSISFTVAREFIDAAREAQLGDEELVAVLVTAIVLVTALKRGVDSWSRRLSTASAKRIADDASVTVEKSRGILEFSSLLLSIIQSITLSICVQVLAVSVRANQPSRIVRVTTMMGVVVFFVFFESAATRS